MARTQVFSDNFNRAAPLGGNWTQTNNANAGAVTIDSSIRAVGSFGLQAGVDLGAARWSGAGSFGTYTYVKAILTNAAADLGGASGAGVQLCCSGADATRSCYEFYMLQDGPGSGVNSTTRLVRWVSGARTVLASGTQSWSNGDSIELEYDETSDTLTGYRNGTALPAFTVTDASLTGGTPGIVATAAVFVDDAEGGNVTGAAAQNALNESGWYPNLEPQTNPIVVTTWG